MCIHVSVCVCVCVYQNVRDSSSDTYSSLDMRTRSSDYDTLAVSPSSVTVFGFRREGHGWFGILQGIKETVICYSSLCSVYTCVGVYLCVSVCMCVHVHVCVFQTVRRTGTEI